MPAMGDSAGQRLPGAPLDVYRTPELVPLALGGPVRTATALPMEWINDRCWTGR
ncbi:hypothetical protein [Streptomyces sp. NPDC048282]|uniref:hypothetical protein n=1 Tax=Streptomyces sp. NPDC048282 TaxID=3365528 RepID=UPI00371321F5